MPIHNVKVVNTSVLNARVLLQHVPNAPKGLLSQVLLPVHVHLDNMLALNSPARAVRLHAKPAQAAPLRVTLVLQDIP